MLLPFKSFNHGRVGDLYSSASKVLFYNGNAFYSNIIHKKLSLEALLDYVCSILEIWKFLAGITWLTA